jgi:hypothetical protein
LCHKISNQPQFRVLSSTIVQVGPESDGVYFQKSKHKTYNKNGTTVGGFMQKATSITMPKRLKTLDSVAE